MEYLVTMTTHVPHGTPDEAVEDVRAARPPTRVSWPHRDTCFGSGVLRCSQENGAVLGCLRPMTATSSRRCWPRCRYGYGGPMR